MSGIFDGLDPTRQGESIVKGADRIEQYAARMKESVRWSIAELKLSPGDIAWLHQWAGSLLADQTELNLQYSSRSPKFGLLFLALAAEVCRRETEESEAWPIIRNIGWKPEVKAVLFNKQGAAKPLLCRAIEASCLQYGLRNIVGQQGKMYWFTTIKLQFGLTRSGLTGQLGKWLYFDALPNVAQLLLQDEENRSESFAHLIESLEAYQDGFKHEQELHDVLTDSSWILEEWVDDVLATASRKPAVPRGNWQPSEPMSAAQVSDEEQVIPCVGKPTIVWNAGSVEFVASVNEEIDELCSSDRYFVSVEDETKALFVKQPGDRFARAGGTGRDIQFAAKTPNASIAITDGTSEPVAVELVPLFDPDADLEAWVEGSAGRYRPVDVESQTFESSRSYTFRMPLDAVIEPPDAVSHEWTSGAQKWVCVPRDWPPDLRIVLDDSELLAAGQFHREPIDTPMWVNSISVRPTDVNWERGTFRLRISLRPDVRLLGARVFGKAIGFADCGSPTFKSVPIPIELHDAKGSVDVRLAAVNGDDRRVIRRKERIPLDGLLINHNGVWQRHLPNDELNVGTLRRKTCLVNLPSNFEASSRPWVAIQGYREVGVPTNRPGQVRDLAGWGQPLELAEGRYNRPVGDPYVKLASRVIDHGCILDCIQMPGSDNVIVRLQDPIEPSNEHCIVVWTSEGHLVAIGRDNITPTENGSVWQFDRSTCGLDYSGSIVAVAAAFRGKRLGAWWTDDWSRYVRYCICDGHAKEAAALMRWFQFPVLDPRDASTIHALGTEHGLAFAEAWLVWRDDSASWQPTGTDRIMAMEHLRPPTADPTWYEVVRVILADWMPLLDEADHLGQAFDQIDQADAVPRKSPLTAMVEQIAEAAPLLLGRLVGAWLAGCSEPPPIQQWLLDHLATDIRFSHSDSRRVPESEDSDPRVVGLSLSPPFVDGMLESAQALSTCKPLESHEAENLQTLLQHPNVSRLVAAHLLESLEPR